MAESVGYKLAEFCIPTDILVPGSEIKREYLTAPTCPVIVFINCKSGGQLGGDLLKTYQDLLNKNQVFDLGTWAPDKVLHQLYSNIEKLKQGGDKLAYEIEKRLRIIVAGGDGTAGWILGVVCDLKLPLPPPVVTVPLGTGNNLPFSFGWVRFRSCVRAGYLLVSAATANIAGERPVSMCLPLAYDPFSHQGKKNPGIDHQSVEAFLEEVKTARVMQVDSWHILMKMKAPEKGPCDPIAPLELPNALHAFRRISQKEPCDGYHTYRGGFWNYFSMGMDAQVSYAFHSERKLHPEKFRNQLLNQSAYAKLGCKQGWFCASLLHPSSRNIAQLTKVKVMRRPGHWEELDIPRCIRSIICLNLPSFSGGFNPWGTPCRKRSLERGFTHPFVDDSLIEIVGFKDAWHGLVLLAPHGHGTRLAQANRVRFEFHKGVADHTFMRIDGEPWKQPLPLDDDTVVVEISHFSRVSILARPPCRSKSIYEPSSPFSPRFEGDDSDIEVANESWEERRKLGVADTFKIEDVDFSHLS